MSRGEVTGVWIDEADGIPSAAFVAVREGREATVSPIRWLSRYEAEALYPRSDRGSFEPMDAPDALSVFLSPSSACQLYRDSDGNWRTSGKLDLSRVIAFPGATGFAPSNGIEPAPPE